MKKRMALYVTAWAVLLALFNVLTFIPFGIEQQEKYTHSFWIGYIFITLTFVGQLICSFIAFKADETKKIFYKIPLFKAGYTGLIASFVAGGLCMIISPLPYWVGIVLCSIFLAVNILSVVKASGVISEIEQIDEKVKTQTFFVKSLTVDADTLMASAKSEVVRAECRKVYEAIRYSDPMSNNALSSVESQITVKFAELSEAVNADNTEKVTELAKTVIVLVGDRNKKCKLLK